MSTNINVVGTIATDPKLVKSGSGVQLCSFRIASDERRYDREQQAWVEGNTNWLGIVCFRGLATHALESFNKGDRIIVSGRLRVREWEKEERRGTSVEIEADAIGHDVRWGVSTFDKRVGSASNESSETAQSDTEAPAVNSQGEPSNDGFLPRAAA